MRKLSTEILSRRKYPRVAKGRKQWVCRNCERDIHPGDEHEHSFASREDQQHGVSPDIRLCTTCSVEVNLA
jgi:hypothetical protein